MRTSTYKRLKANITQAIGGVFAEHAAGVRRLSVAEIVALSNILNAEKPTVFAIQSVLVNELAYLATYDAPVAAGVSWTYPPNSAMAARSLA